MNLTLTERDSGCGNAGDLTAELSDSTVTLDAKMRMMLMRTNKLYMSMLRSQKTKKQMIIAGKSRVQTTPNLRKISDTVDLELGFRSQKVLYVLIKDQFESESCQKELLLQLLAMMEIVTGRSIARTGERASWVSFDGPSSGVLPYGDGSEPKHLI